MGATIFEQPVAEGELKIPAIRGVGGGVIYFIDEQERSRAASGTSSSSRVDDRGVARRRPHAHRPHRADDELRRDADLGAVLHLDLRDREKPDGRRARSLRPRPQPGHRERRGLPPPHPQRRREQPHHRRPLHQRNLRLQRPAPRLRLVRHLRHRRGDGSRRLQRRSTSRPTTTTTSPPASASTTASSQQLRAANILYDRDEGGEFFQFYSQHVRRRLLLRDRRARGGYRGYGGPNAPFRIAAQKRAMQQDAFATL